MIATDEDYISSYVWPVATYLNIFPYKHIFVFEITSMLIVERAVQK